MIDKDFDWQKEYNRAWKQNDRGICVYISVLEVINPSESGV